MDELLSYQTPHSTEAEQAVLGAILIDEECIPTVVEKLRPEEFYLRQNREIYESIYRMFNYSQKIDLVTILDQLKQDGYFQERTSAEYLKQLVALTPTSANVMAYVDIIKDKAVLRALAKTCGEIGELVRAGGETGQDLIDVAEQRLLELRQGRSTVGLEPLDSVMPPLLTRLGELGASGSELPGLSTGLKGLDRAITGLNKSDLIILAARPGMGKTALALNIALHVGKFSHKKVAVFSLEMSKEQLGLRLLSSESLVENRVLATGMLTDEQWLDVVRAASLLGETTILLDDDPMVTVADINAKCRRLGQDLGLVVIDYLQLMNSAGTGKGFESRQQAVSDISRALKIMAKNLKVPVICLSQLSRANEKDKTTVRRPRLSDLRDSGAIEQDADIVLFLHREDYYDDSGEADPNSAECIVAKNRHGDTGIIRLAWRPQFTAFLDADDLDMIHEEP